MKRLKRGDVVLTVFPFTGLAAEKRRLALVLNENAEHGDVILAFIGTHIPSSPSKTSIVLDLSDSDFRRTGRKTKSVIRLEKLATIERRLITRRLGRLESERMKTVDRALILALQITRGISET
jgi:mRNA interferase MazF